MTRFAVVWVQSALDELTDLWLESSSRESVTAAVQVIDETLAKDAASQGIELSEGLRALFAPPLRVLFAVREDDRLVEVLRVKRL